MAANHGRECKAMAQRQSHGQRRLSLHNLHQWRRSTCNFTFSRRSLGSGNSSSAITATVTIRFEGR